MFKEKENLSKSQKTVHELFIGGKSYMCLFQFNDLDSLMPFYNQVKRAELERKALVVFDPDNELEVAFGANNYTVAHYRKEVNKDIKISDMKNVKFFGV